MGTSDPNMLWDYCEPLANPTPAPEPEPTPSPEPEPPVPGPCQGEDLSGNGQDYRGCQTKTKSGITCQKWTSQDPHQHGFTPENYPDAGLGDHNYCRNPDGDSTIWCYTSDPNMLWEYCEPLANPTPAPQPEPTPAPEPEPTPAPEPEPTTTSPLPPTDDPM